MSELYENLMAGLNDVLAYVKGEPVDAVIHYFPAPDVKNIRARMGMTQLEFSRVFGVSVGTLRNWEQGRRTPHGPSSTLLRVMDKEPEAVKRALAAVREDFKNHKVVRVARRPDAPEAPAPAKPAKAAKGKRPRPTPHSTFHAPHSTNRP